jgi:hypothetical protein
MSEQDTRSAALRALTEEAREHLSPSDLAPAHAALSDREWASIERGIALEQARTKRQAAWLRGAVAGSLALAACAIGFLGLHREDHATLHPTVLTAAPSIVSHAVRTLGEAATDKTEVRSGETVKITGSGRLVLAQDIAGKHIDWSLSAAGQSAGVARVEKRDGALRIALEQGSVECDVEPGSQTPVLFVNAGDTRVVVRGTHFRVERNGTFVRVDLTRGKVSVEQSDGASRTLLAPSHVSVDVRDGRPEILQDSDALPEEGFTSLEVKETVLSPNKPAVSLVRLTRAQLTTRLDACIAKGLPAGRATGVSLESVLAMTVDGSGNVVASHFEPPLPPDAERCAKDVLRAHSFTERGEVVRLPFRVTR